MLAKSPKENDPDSGGRTVSFEREVTGGGTASAKRTQRSLQAVGEIAEPRKLIQPRKRQNADGDALRIAEASMEGAQWFAPEGPPGSTKTVACRQGNALELGRPGYFLHGGGSGIPTQRRMPR